MSIAKQGEFARLFDKGDYHDGGSRGSTRRHPTLPAKELRVGIELEVEHSNGWESVLEHFPVASNVEDIPWFEGDGSLSSELGVEIVFPPLTPRTYLDASTFVGEFFSNLEDDNGVMDSGRAGMHVNVNVTGFTLEQKLAFIGTIWGCTRAQLRAIGGREPNGYCNWTADPTPQHIFQRAHSKYNVAHIRCNAADASSWERATCVEVRFPASTNDRRQLDRVLTFIEAAWHASLDEEYIIPLFDSLHGNRSFTVLRHYAQTQITNPIFDRFLQLAGHISYDNTLANPFDSTPQSAVRRSENTAAVLTPEELDTLWNNVTGLEWLGSGSQARQRAIDAYDLAWAARLAAHPEEA